MGAWIEIDIILGKTEGIESHPTWVRGLKFIWTDTTVVCMESHPTWVRGLK